jgi:mRNA interferase RelE/StbE
MSKALWHLRYAPEAERNLKSFDRQIARRILKYLDERIAPLENPRAIGKALKGSKLGDFWRYDHGDYRIIVDIVDKEILICVIRIETVKTCIAESGFRRSSDPTASRPPKRRRGPGNTSLWIKCAGRLLSSCVQVTAVPAWAKRRRI